MKNKIHIIEKRNNTVVFLFIKINKRKVALVVHYNNDCVRYYRYAEFRDIGNNIEINTHSLLSMVETDWNNELIDIR